jgi:hypothetical protein
MLAQHRRAQPLRKRVEELAAVRRGVSRAEPQIMSRAPSINDSNPTSASGSGGVSIACV